LYLNFYWAVSLFYNQFKTNKMKTILAISALILVITFTACNSNSSKPTNNANSTQTQVDAATPDEATNNTNPAEGILTGYLNLKNSLAADNGNDAAKNGQEILNALSTFDASKLTSEQKKVFLGLAGDIKENSEHIHENGGDIKHQREHFEMLSKDITDLVKSIGTNKTLYLDSCPMYDKGNGTWLSEIKDIKNPYLGRKMDTCGAIKETIKN
jgi:hypothetical protein